ncbi:MAG TPA: enoyl-ACP reductase [bacterium]|nr:enoyl-ACP reductase [bacterium]
MIDFSGKRGVILGVANQRSIAFAVAKLVSQLGGELCLTYGPDPKGRFEQNVRDLAQGLQVTQILPLDLRSDQEIETLFKTLEASWGRLDFVLHSAAFADRADLEVPFSRTSREGWRLAMDVSAYSFLPVSREAARLMKTNGGGSIVGMTFIGSVLAVPNYHVMGPAKAALEASIRYLARELGPDNVRFNTVSAGAIRTLSSSGIKQFGEMLKIAGEHAALQRNVTLEEVAQTTAFLLSSASSGITGQCVYVDCGYNIMAN